MQITNHSFTIRKDDRWRDWARAVCEGTTLARRKWVGPNRPFRRREYDQGMYCLFGAEIIRLDMTQKPKPGFVPNRAGGWRYIQQMARGEKVLPPPPLTTPSADERLRHFAHAKDYPKALPKDAPTQTHRDNIVRADHGLDMDFTEISADPSGRGGDPLESEDE